MVEKYCINLGCDFGLPPEVIDNDYNTYITLTNDATQSGVTHITMNVTKACIESQFNVQISLSTTTQCSESNLAVSHDINFAPL